MNNCKKCGKSFLPKKGLVNYCSMSCRQSRPRPESVRQKISEGVKSSKFQYSSEWLAKVTKANQNKNKIKKQKETFKKKRNYNTAHKSTIKKWYLETQNNCEQCGLNEWMGQEIILEVHHIDSNTDNNHFDNLKALCPNCHSFTDGWRNRKVI